MELINKGSEAISQQLADSSHVAQIEASPFAFLPAVKVVFINKEELWVEVDKTDVGDEDHAREDAAFWMASRGCIHV